MNFMKEKSYKEALEIADSINWKKVKNLAVLCAASEVYEANEEYQKGRKELCFARRGAEKSSSLYARTPQSTEGAGKGSLQILLRISE